MILLFRCGECRSVQWPEESAAYPLLRVGGAGFHDAGWILGWVDRLLSSESTLGTVVMGWARRWCCGSLYTDSGCLEGCGRRGVKVVRWPGDMLGADLSKVICGNCGVVVYWVLVVGGGGVGED